MLLWSQASSSLPAQGCSLGPSNAIETWSCGYVNFNWRNWEMEMLKRRHVFSLMDSSKLRAKTGTNAKKETWELCGAQEANCLAKNKAWFVKDMLKRTGIRTWNQIWFRGSSKHVLCRDKNQVFLFLEGEAEWQSFATLATGSAETLGHTGCTLHLWKLWSSERSKFFPRSACLSFSRCL